MLYLDLRMSFQWSDAVPKQGYMQKFSKRGEGANLGYFKKREGAASSSVRGSTGS